MSATHYGASYNGQRMGCAPYNAYSSYDTTIAAIGTQHYAQWPCGTTLEVSGPNGTIYAIRQDSCPGCDLRYPNMIDLSEAGHAIVCGVGTCRVQVTVVSND